MCVRLFLSARHPSTHSNTVDDLLSAQGRGSRTILISGLDEYVRGGAQPPQRTHSHLPTQITDDEVRQLFQGIGTVTNVERTPDPFHPNGPSVVRTCAW